ncbi:MAG: response regulator [Myxococcales bacterium]|nr:response regulator [Myxococcales bacterium]
MKVLIVDDESTTLELYGALLEDEGHEVLTRDRAMGTTLVIISEQPDVVLVDVGMPGLPGDELVRVVRDNPRARGVNVVLFSARPGTELAKIASRCGARGYIEKNEDHELFLEDFRKLAAGLN